MRGQFTRADGLILPNNISLQGSEMILKAALWNQYTGIYAALVVGVPTPNMDIGMFVEPTIGVSGYARIPIPRDNTGWPNTGVFGGVEYGIGSKFLQFVATAAYDKQVQRVALVGNAAHTFAEPVFALSSALPQPFTPDQTTPPAELNFRYTLYL